VTNYIDGTVSELRASDGTLVRTVNIGAGTEPLGIAFDGADMWVANRGGGTVTKIRVSDGTVLGNFPAPDGAYGIAFDGAYLWISGALYVQVVRASDVFWSLSGKSLLPSALHLMARTFGSQTSTRTM